MLPKEGGGGVPNAVIPTGIHQRDDFDQPDRFEAEDTLLAAQCLAKGHTLVTDKAKHFELLRPAAQIFFCKSV
jgi:hypothetical protein